MTSARTAAVRKSEYSPPAVDGDFYKITDVLDASERAILARVRAFMEREVAPISFRDTAQVLKMTRAGVAWFAVGCQMGAYEHALRYAQRRMQFGRPIGGFQLVQDLLVRMLGNVTATQTMMLRLSQLRDQGLMRDEHASLAKAYCTVKCRETVGYARELLGGNGILLDEHIGRFVADAEAIYSYEGTREMNTLIVGKSITGLSAFV